MVRRVGFLVTVLVFIAGAVFFLQGLRFLPSPLMYGKPEWVVIGAAVMLVSAIAAVRLAR